MEINRINQKCPYCGELSPLAVTACQHCGHQLKRSDYLSPSLDMAQNAPRLGTEGTPPYPTGLTDPFLGNGPTGQHLVPRSEQHSLAEIPPRHLQRPNRQRRAIVLAAVLIPAISILGAGGIAEYIINNKNNTSPSSMVRVTIKLVDVYCKTKETMWPGHDHFYVLTALAAPDKNPNAPVSTQVQLSQPLDITSGQD